MDLLIGMVVFAVMAVWLYVSLWRWWARPFMYAITARQWAWAVAVGLLGWPAGLIYLGTHIDDYTPPGRTINVASAAGFPVSGNLKTSFSDRVVAYTGKARGQFTGVRPVYRKGENVVLGGRMLRVLKTLDNGQIRCLDLGERRPSAVP